MSKITDYNILTALKSGQTVSLNGDLFLRELLNGGEGVVYALYQEKSFWKPYSPTVWELEQCDWQVVDKEEK